MTNVIVVLNALGYFIWPWVEWNPILFYRLKITHEMAKVRQKKSVCQDLQKLWKREWVLEWNKNHSFCMYVFIYCPRWKLMSRQNQQLLFFGITLLSVPNSFPKKAGADFKNVRPLPKFDQDATILRKKILNGDKSHPHCASFFIIFNLLIPDFLHV